MPNGDLTRDSQEIGETLNNFSSVYSKMRATRSYLLSKTVLLLSHWNPSRSQKILEKALDKVIETKSKGQDNIHPIQKGLDTTPENYLCKLPGRKQSTRHIESGPFLCDT